MGRKIIDYTGKRFGKWTVIGHSTKSSKYAKAMCDCGTICDVYKMSLKHGTTTKCWECRTEEQTVHGKKPKNLYTCWKNMHKRCNGKCGPNNYKDYFLRGLKVCDEWNEFVPFRNWALKNGWKNGLSIERLDNDKGYFPENCTWALSKVQNRNKRNNVFISLFGETKCITDWIGDSRCLVSKITLRKRIKAGIDPHDAMTVKYMRGI